MCFLHWSEPLVLNGNSENAHLCPFSRSVMECLLVGCLLEVWYIIFTKVAEMPYYSKYSESFFSLVCNASEILINI